MTVGHSRTGAAEEVCHVVQKKKKMPDSFEDASRTFQKDTELIIRELTVKVVPLQKRAYACALRCFDRPPPDDIDAIGRCVQYCQAGAESFGDRLKQEMSAIQTQVEACHQACHSKFSMPYANAATDDARDRVQRDMHACSAACFTDAKPQLSAIKARMLEYILQSQSKP